MDLLVDFDGAGLVPDHPGAGGGDAVSQDGTVVTFAHGVEGVVPGAVLPLLGHGGDGVPEVDAAGEVFLECPVVGL